MKTPHDKFLENYVAVKRPCNNKTGFRIEYVYCKPWKVWDIPLAKQKQKLLHLLLCSLANILLFILCATRYVEVNSIKLVEGHALISIIALIYESIGVMQLILSGEKITMPTFYDLDRKIKIATALHSILLFGAIAYGIYYIVAKQIKDSSPMVLVGFALCAGLSILIRILYKSINFSTVPNETTKDSLFKNDNLESP